MKKYSIILLTFLALMGSSCKKDFLNIDEVNPNNPSQVPPKLVLPTALVDVSDVMNYPANWDFVYLWYGVWSISGGYAPSAAMTSYNITTAYYTGNWQNLYLSGKNFDYIIQNSMTEDQKDFRGIGRIMKAYCIQNLVDVYGDVPYSQAFKTDAGILKPAYDNQQAIYEDLVDQLDTAIHDILTAPASSVPPNAKQDVVFSGDMGLWVKFANTLKLRILLHQAGMGGDRPAYIASHITDSYGYLGAGEGAMVQPGYSASTNKQNPFWDRFFDPSGAARADGLAYYVANQDALDFLGNSNDPRLTAFFSPGSTAPGNAYIGAYYGQSASLPVGSTEAIIGDGLLQAATQPSILLSDYESLFIQAEAAQRGLIAGDPQTLYEAAITANFEYVGFTSTDAADFLTSAAGIGDVNVDWSSVAAADKIKLIITQKWAALNATTPVELWTDYRRTGFPDFLHFTQNPNRIGPGNPPVRLFYPSTEISYNNDNELAAEKRDPSGRIDLFSSKIFWQNR